MDVVLAGIPIDGFKEGTFIEVEREEDTYKKKVGSLGDVTRTRSLNRSGKITFTTMAAAPVNARLTALADDDEDDGSGVGAFSLKDRSTNSEARSTSTWIMKRPKMERAQESGDVQWVLEAAYIDIKHGAGVATVPA